MKITNLRGLPEALVKAVTLRRHTPGRLSATAMLNGMKNIILSDRHWDDLEEDVADRLWSLLGQAGHSLLEEEGADEFTEEYMSHELDGITITGRMDNYNMRHGRVTDYKFISVYKILKTDFEDWNKQGMIYAWLLLKNGFEAKTCRFLAIIKDHSKLKAKHNPSYPQCSLFVYEFPVTDEGIAEIEAFLKGKVSDYKRHREMKDDEIPPCTPKERWDEPTTYAVIKTGNKKAYRVKKTQEDADALAAELDGSYYVETRIGVSKKCMGYCACSEFCDFYQKNVKPVEEAMAKKDAEAEKAAVEEAAA